MAENTPVSSLINIKMQDGSFISIHPQTNIENVNGLTDALNDKVDKVSGKGLSTNDYTTTEKNKLSGIANNANNYSHPTTSGNKHIPSGGSSGQILRWSADGTAVWGNDNNTTYSAVGTTGDPGLMTAADKVKLDGIDKNANKITVDSALSDTSTNPVQNKVIKAAIDNLLSSKDAMIFKGTIGTGGTITALP